MSTASRQVVVYNERGLHARPAMEFVETANKFKAAVSVEKSGDEPMKVDGKSIMEMITLAAVQGTNLVILADGEDAEAAVTQLADLFEGRFRDEK